MRSLHSQQCLCLNLMPELKYIIICLHLSWMHKLGFREQMNLQEAQQVIGKVLSNQYLPEFFCTTEQVTVPRNPRNTVLGRPSCHQPSAGETITQNYPCHKCLQLLGLSENTCNCSQGRTPVMLLWYRIAWCLKWLTQKSNHNVHIIIFN